MLIVQAPLRISLFGGGTDLPAYCGQHGTGMVLSAAIDRAVYVVLQRRFDELICAHYTRRELVTEVSEIQHDLIREALSWSAYAHGLEITTLADIPSEGSGLGSSSSLTVALIQAIRTWDGVALGPRQVAAAACDVEINRLHRPIGRQDQYAAAYGGLNFLTFRGDNVTVEPLCLPEVARWLSERLLLFYTGMSRQASTVLADQCREVAAHLVQYRRLAEMAMEGRCLLEAGALDQVGRLLNDSWAIKRGLCPGISTPEIDAMYQTARTAGALGGKVTGAGGGGFLLLYVPLAQQEEVRRALAAYRELEFGFDARGSRVIFDQGR